MYLDSSVYLYKYNVIRPNVDSRVYVAPQYPNMPLLIIVFYTGRGHNDTTRIIIPIMFITFMIEKVSGFAYELIETRATEWTTLNRI